MKPSFKLTKIVATVGPASAKVSVLCEMLRAGVDLFRLNGAHGDSRQHLANLRLIRAAGKRAGKAPGVLFDLPGPKIRLGELASEPVLLSIGQKVTLECGLARQRGRTLPLPMAALAKALSPGQAIFINDGLVRLRVIAVRGRTIEARVDAGGEIRSRKGVNLPQAKLNIPSLTAADRRLLLAALRGGVDYVGLSFVRRPGDIRALRRLVARLSPETRLVAKIEKPEALDNLNGIVAAADAIMVARGDLGIEIPFAEVPGVQRRIIETCRLAGKPVITATQMLLSMVSAQRPTRAEASDVAQAVWEGTDALMLSEETSVGQNPVAAVAAMAEIAARAERQRPKLPWMQPQGVGDDRQAQVLSQAAVRLAEELAAATILAPSRSGRAPLAVSRQRPTMPVLAPTVAEAVARRMQLYYAVRPLLMKRAATLERLLTNAQAAALKSGGCRRGQLAVVVSGAYGRQNRAIKFLEVRQL